MKYTAIIGMEVHVELKTKSKMFCSCVNDPFAASPNTHICATCLGHPGTLPLVNKQAIIDTVTIGKALGCTIREYSKFDRKHYFYPDLPKGYQISQYDEPIAENGEVTIDLTLTDNPRPQAVISITRAHLEEDTAKLLHDTDGATLVDFNRSGVPLVEIVTGPDFQSGIEAKAYCQELRTMLRFLNVSDADMEKGQMRCEANISVQVADSFDIVNGAVVPRPGVTLNNKVELKNLNSFKAVERGIAFEIARQTQMIEDGQPWIQQTRGWDEDKGETVMQREKENAADYRYFPEPDIPPFHPLTIAGKTTLPELPQKKSARFKQEYGFSGADAKRLSEDKALGAFTEQVMSELVDWLHSLPEVQGESDDIAENHRTRLAKLTSNWLINNLLTQVDSIDAVHISAENFAEFIALIYTEKINSTNAQKLLVDMLGKGTNIDPSHIMEEKGYGQVQDTVVLQSVIQEVISNYPDQVAQYKSGKETVIKFLLGMAMKATEGTGDPAMLEALLKQELQ